jgi:hypothetical protein
VPVIIGFSPFVDNLIRQTFLPHPSRFFYLIRQVRGATSTSTVKDFYLIRQISPVASTSSVKRGGGSVNKLCGFCGQLIIQTMLQRSKPDG